VKTAIIFLPGFVDALITTLTIYSKFDLKIISVIYLNKARMLLKSSMPCRPRKQFLADLKENVPPGHIAIFNNKHDRWYRPFHIIPKDDILNSVKRSVRRGTLTERSANFVIKKLNDTTRTGTQEYELHTSNSELISYFNIY